MSKLDAARWFFRHRPVVQRSRQIARILTGHGLGTLVDQTGLERFAPLLRRRPRPAPLTQAERLRVALGELGATFIKLGQILSTRGDLLPPEFIAELSKLQDSAPPVPLECVRETIASELGAPPEDVFASFDPAPMASASIGQVHAATLANGARVVVKVRRPHVQDEIERDLEILSGIARWVELHTTLGHEYELMPIVEEFAFTIRSELDYRFEGQNADRIRRFLVGDPRFHVPFVYWQHTTERVLTLERLDGIKLSDFDALDQLGIPRRVIAENAVVLFLRTALELGLFHADPHPGNFLIQPDGSIGIVDFGMVGRLNENVRRHLLRAGLAARAQDADSLVEELYALGVAGHRARRGPFLRDLDHVINRYGGMTVRDLSAAEVAGQLTSIAFRHRLQLPGELALIIRVMTMSEGVGLKLDPGFHYLEFAAPYFKAYWERTHSIQSTAQRLGRAAVEAVELSADLPRRAERMLGRLERGDVEFNMRTDGLESLSNQLQRMTNRLAIAVVLAASVVALGIALGVRRLPGLERYLDWLFSLGFVFSLAFGLWLIVSILRAGRR
jgi:ubiquinone biosynthesis protein